MASCRVAKPCHLLGGAKRSGSSPMGILDGECEDERTHEQIVYTLARVHIEHNPWVAKLALTFRAAPYPWMAPWEREAWESLHPDVAWQLYELGAAAGPYPKRRGTRRQSERQPNGKERSSVTGRVHSASTQKRTKRN